MGSPVHARERSSLSRMFIRERTSLDKGAQRRTYLDVDQEHAHALTELKEKIAAAGLQVSPALAIAGDLDATLYRFLRARKYNVQLAYAMLEKSVHWRNQVGADTILEHPIEPRLTKLVRECRPSSYIGYDKEHHIIFVERLGKMDGRRFEREGVSDDVVMSYHLREMEFMAQVVLPEASAAAGHTVDRVVSIMDAAGLTLSALTGFAQRLFRLITAMDSDNYPECCHAIYIVNAGAAFSAIWRLLSPFVDKGTRDKVHVLGNAKASQQALLEAFGPELVPTFLGGTMDYDAVRQQWMEKMDAAIAQRQKNPQGQQPPVVIALANGAQQQQPSHVQQHPHGSSSGHQQWLPHVNTRADRTSSVGDAARVSSAGISSTSADDGWATPMSNASRMSGWSATSGASVYYDAQEPPSPTNASPASSEHGAAGMSPYPHAHTPDMSGGGYGGGPGSVLSGSMSVGPQSRTRSQLSQQSGFTGFGVHTGVGGHAGQDHGVGGSAAGSVVTGQVLVEDGEEVGEGKHPVCGCRCVIS